jgi:hypothetical protein
VPPGNCGALSVNDKALFFTASDAAGDAKTRLHAFAIDHLQQLITQQPVEVPPAPKRPDKSWKPS